MTHPQTGYSPIPRAHAHTRRLLDALRRLSHVEAVGGGLLLLAAAVALIWANSPWASHYQALWHLPVGFTLGPWQAAPSLHFWINDGLMTLFFLVVGMEIRREMHDGALRQMRQAALPVLAAVGGVLAPALIYILLNLPDATRLAGWAVPTATDIAFAIGLLALLGKSIPPHLRVFLLTLAIIDDLIAVLIIALFYSGGLAWEGFAVVGAGLLLTLGLQRTGFGSAWAYVLPGAIVWAGMLLTGSHPTLAGVLLGLLTPVRALPTRQPPALWLAQTSAAIQNLAAQAETLSQPLRDMRLAQRELLPPAVRVPQSLHPWVAFGIMPLFALANAGVELGNLDLSQTDTLRITLGVLIALVLGKPLGVLLTCGLLVRLGWCRLPPGVSWAGIGLIGLLAGVGFTMSIFIAMLAFADPGYQNAAKLGVLLGSLASALLGLAWGLWYVRGLRRRAAG